MTMDTPQRKPTGKTPPPGSRPTTKPLTKKQRRNQAAVRSVALSRRPPWQSPTVITSVSVGIVAVVLIVIVLINQIGGANVGTSVPISANVASILLHPDATVISTVGSGSQPGELVKLPGDTVLKDASGKPMIVYVGAEYCPFCAAERWVMIYWLSQFGTFTGLTQIESSSTDVYADTNTFTFYKSHYTSQYVDFVPNEVLDRDQNPLQTPSSQVSALFTKYGTPPYTSTTGGFPFIDLAGLYTLYNTSYTPQILANLTWQQIATKLKDPTDPVTQAIVGNANIMTAATCIATDDVPSSVCTTPTIQAIEPTLKALKTPPS
jgi:hypothetical protein